MLMLSAPFLHGCVSGNSTWKIPAVRDFQPERYLGRWYEIARLPHWFEEGMREVTAEYTRLDGGRIRVVNRGMRDGRAREISGVAKLKGDPGTGELRVSFFRPFYADYRIIELDPEYSCALVTGARRDFFWILSRTPVIADELLRQKVEHARHCGFPVEKLIFSQNPH